LVSRESGEGRTEPVLFKNFLSIMNQNENVFNFEKLLVYQKSLDSIDVVYKITDAFPQNERFNLTDQFRRAATSIALNIGEGSGGTDKEFNSFLRISKRSMKECVVCSTLAARRKYITLEQELMFRNKLVELAKMNSGLSKSVRGKIDLSNKSKTQLSVLPTPD
jgi:four helix bundle protein